MKTQGMQKAAAALMMASILMMAAGQAEAKKRLSLPAIQPTVISTDSARPAVRPDGRQPDDPRAGVRVGIEREAMWAVLINHWLY